jgi:hypothetical protein
VLKTMSAPLFMPSWTPGSLLDLPQHGLRAVAARFGAYRRNHRSDAFPRSPAFLDGLKAIYKAVTKGMLHIGNARGIRVEKMSKQ